MLTDTDWCSLMLIDADWRWRFLIWADWCWWMLIDAQIRFSQVFFCRSVPPELLRWFLFLLSQCKTPAWKSWLCLNRVDSIRYIREKAFSANSLWILHDAENFQVCLSLCKSRWHHPTFIQMSNLDLRSSLEFWPQLPFETGVFGF